MDMDRATVSAILGNVSGGEAQLTRRFRVQWVERLLSEADVEAPCDPLWLAVATGHSVRPILPGEIAPTLLDQRTVYYGWTGDLRATGGRVFSGLASRLLAPSAHSPSDVHLLAAELAVPEFAVRGLSVGEVVRRQRWAPVWLIEARMAGLTSSGVYRSGVYRGRGAVV